MSVAPTLKNIQMLAPLSPGREPGLNLAALETWIVDVPTTRQHKLSNTAVTHQSYVIIRVTLDNGVTGIGEAATLGGPRWAEESVEAIQANIITYLWPTITGLSVSNRWQIVSAMRKAAKRNSAAKAAVEMACLDAFGKTVGLSASSLLGGQVRERIPAIWALASGDVGQEIEEAQQKIADRQFNRFKIKLGFANPKEDIKRLSALRKNLGPQTTFIVDVNQAWSEADCQRWFPALAELGVDLIEQPVDAQNLEAMVRLSQTTTIPLMLDEGCHSLPETQRAVTAGAGTVLSLKLVKSGSTLEMQQAAAISEAAGVELYGGCLLESSIGAAAHLAVFSGLPKLAWGTEHFGPQILKEDLVTEPLRYEDFHVVVPSGPGLGVSLNSENLNKFKRI